MSSPLSCCTPCATVETVNIPGLQGEPGLDGVNGLNAITRLMGSFVIPISPAVGTATVESSAWMVIGQVLIIGEGLNPSISPDPTKWANFRVTAIGGPTQVTLKPLLVAGDTVGDGVKNFALHSTVAPSAA